MTVSVFVTALAWNGGGVLFFTFGCYQNYSTNCSLSQTKSTSTYLKIRYIKAQLFYQNIINISLRSLAYHPFHYIFLIFLKILSGYENIFTDTSSFYKQYYQAVLSQNR